MADLAGMNATVAVSTDGGTNYTTITGITDIKGPTYKVDRIDTTDNDGGGWKDGLAGVRGLTLGLTCNYDEDCVGQAAMRTSATTGVLYKYRYRDQVATGKKEVIFTATCNGSDQGSKTTDKITATYELEACGTVTEQSQT